MFNNVSESQGRLLSSFVALRNRATVISYEAGIDLIRNAGAEWKRAGFSGLAGALYAFAQDIANIPGAWGDYAEAKRLAAAFAAA